MNRLIAKFKRPTVSAKDSKKTPDPTTTRLDADPEPVGSQSNSGPMQVKHGLDSLPSEVRRYLLSTLDISQLKALVSASAVFHQQYIFDRKYLLCRCLERTMGRVTVDAYAVHLSAAQRGDTKQDVTEFLKSYAENTSRRRLLLADKLAEEEAVSMTGFHFRYIKTLTGHYARWMLANLDEAKEAENGPRSHQQGVALTSTETMRVTRAIYRFQLLCHLAGPDDRSLWLSRDHLNETMQAFLDTLEPWEVEELFSFYQFAHDVYDVIIKDVGWDLHPDNPKFNDQGRPPTPDGAFDLEGLSKFRTTALIAEFQVVIRFTQLTLVCRPRDISRRHIAMRSSFAGHCSFQDQGSRTSRLHDAAAYDNLVHPFQCIRGRSW